MHSASFFNRPRRAAAPGRQGPGGRLLRSHSLYSFTTGLKHQQSKRMKTINPKPLFNILDTFKYVASKMLIYY